MILASSVARADDDDIARLTWGRVTNPEGSFVVLALPSYTFHRIGDPMQDSAGVGLSAQYGVTDRLTLEVIAAADDATPRNKLRPDRAGIGIDYRILDAPFQLGINTDFTPSFDGKPHTAVLGLFALHRWGDVIATVSYNAEVEKGDMGWSSVHELGLDGVYTFGLNGLVGVGVDATTDGATAVSGLVGGRINKHLFMGLVATAGLTGDAPSLSVQTQLQVYFGPYYSAGLE